jgi:flagellar assembly factor FliW
MRIQTRMFGDIDITADDVIVFPAGIPPFNELREYCLLAREEEPGLCCLQAVRAPDIAFAVLPPAVIIGEYEIDLSDADAAEIQLERVEDAELFVILAVHREPSRVTANLRAPLVINRRRRLGKQVILQETEYPRQHMLHVVDECAEF